MDIKPPIDISFVICAHNEERIIQVFLENLRRSMTPRTEAIIGLDGCTDCTAPLASAAGVGKVIEFSVRRGKSATLADLVKRAAGRIIIVCDVDWEILAKPGWDEALIKTFDDLSIGAIVIPTANMPQVDKSYLDTMNAAFLGEAWGTRLLWEYQLNTLTRHDGGRVLVNRSTMWFPFAVNICRKELIGEFSTTGDDFERCMQVLVADKEIMVDVSESFLFRATDVKKSFRDMFRQRTRGSTVYGSLADRYRCGLRPGPFMAHQLFYALSQLWRLGIKGSAALLAWYAVALLGYAASRLRLSDVSTGELWKLRARR
jgi:hypothetical protein